MTGHTCGNCSWHHFRLSPPSSWLQSGEATNEGLLFSVYRTSSCKDHRYSKSILAFIMCIEAIGPMFTYTLRPLMSAITLELESAFWFLALGFACELALLPVWGGRGVCPCLFRKKS
jgi:hypothetical protein